MHSYKHLFSALPLFLIVGLCAQVAVAQQDDAQATEMAEIEAMFLDDIRTEFSEVISAATSDILQNSVYRYDYTTFASQEDDSGWQSSRERFLYRHGDQLYRYRRPTTNIEMPFFDHLIDPDFRLNEDSASAFRDLLVTLSGDDFFEAVETDAIQQHEGEWAFVTGTFFSDYKAYVVTVDDAGHVEGVAYDLKYMSQ